VEEVEPKVPISYRDSAIEHRLDVRPCPIKRHGDRLRDSVVLNTERWCILIPNIMCSPSDNVMGPPMHPCQDVQYFLQINPGFEEYIHGGSKRKTRIFSAEDAMARESKFRSHTIPILKHDTKLLVLTLENLKAYSLKGQSISTR